MGFSVGAKAQIHGCHRLGGSQLLRLNTKGQLASGERCLVARGGHIEITVCPTQPTGEWEYLEVGGPTLLSNIRAIDDKDSKHCRHRPIWLFDIGDSKMQDSSINGAFGVRS